MLVHNSRDSDTVGRLGGDEFALIMMHASEIERQKKTALLSETISIKQIEAHGKSISITTSYGVCGSHEAETGSTMMKRADERMYRMKIAKTEQ